MAVWLLLYVFPCPVKVRLKSLTPSDCVEQWWHFCRVVERLDEPDEMCPRFNGRGDDESASRRLLIRPTFLHFKSATRNLYIDSLHTSKSKSNTDLFGSAAAHTAPQPSPIALDCTGRPDRMSHRKWRETKQQPSRARSGHQLRCCLVSLHFLCDILSGRPVCLLT